MIQRWKEWWSTARSSLIVHRRMKWLWIILWVIAEITGQVTDVALVSRLSFIALILGSWSAEEATKAEVRKEEQEE